MKPTDDLERVVVLPTDATAIERALAFEPKTGAGRRHRCGIVTRWGRAVGLDRYEP